MVVFYEKDCDYKLKPVLKWNIYKKSKNLVLIGNAKYHQNMGDMSYNIIYNVQNCVTAMEKVIEHVKMYIYMYIYIHQYFKFK